MFTEVSKLIIQRGGEVVERRLYGGNSYLPYLLYALSHLAFLPFVFLKHSLTVIHISNRTPHNPFHWKSLTNVSRSKANIAPKKLKVRQHEYLCQCNLVSSISIKLTNAPGGMCSLKPTKYMNIEWTTTRDHFSNWKSHLTAVGLCQPFKLQFASIFLFWPLMGAVRGCRLLYTFRRPVRETFDLWRMGLYIKLIGLDSVKLFFCCSALCII